MLIGSLFVAAIPLFILDWLKWRSKWIHKRYEVLLMVVWLFSACIYFKLIYSIIESHPEYHSVSGPTDNDLPEPND